jgi:hypothetical protein
MLEYFAQRASDGSSIISEATIVSITARGWLGAPGLYTDQQVEGAQLPLYLSDDNVNPSFSMRQPMRFSEAKWYHSPRGGRPVAGVRRFTWGYMRRPGAR